MLKIENFNIAYTSQSVLIDSDFIADIGLTCIIGRSGVGKSSILNALTDQIAYSCDLYRYNDIELKNLSLVERKALIRHKFAYFTQTDNFISDMTCFDNMRFYANMAGISLSNRDILKYLDMVHLDIDKKKYPDNLSGGEKQRLALAQALAKQTEVILCDEFTASLDPILKHEMIDLLLEIAHSYHKIVIVTSHDQEVYQKADVLYEIQDQKLVKVKDNLSAQSIQKASQTPLATTSTIKGKYLRKYISEKIDRQFAMFLLYSLVSSIVVAISAFLIFYRTQFISMQEIILNRLTQSELSVVNQTMPIFDKTASYEYDWNNKPFGSTVFSQIQNIKHIESIYPFYSVSFVDDISSTDENYTNKIEVTLKDQSKATVEMNNCEMGLMYYALPYYQEQNFDQVQYAFDDTDNNQGAYLTTNLLNQLGFTYDNYQLLEGSTLRTTLYLPVLYEEQESIAGFADDPDHVIPITLYKPIYKPIDIEIPISGVQFEWYNPEAPVDLYLPIEFLEGLRYEVSQDVKLQGNQKVWGPNTYKVFVDDTANLENVNLQIKALDTTIATGNQYLTNTNRYEQTNYIKTTTLAILSIILISGLILSYAYGIYYYQKNVHDVMYFKKNGLKLKEYQHLLSLDILVQAFIVLLLSTPMIIAIFYFTRSMALYAKFPFISKETLGIAICLIVLAFIQTIVSRLHYYLKVKDN